ncbi:MAG: two component, sigma54 specific, transcriptional regulator, Fis family [Variovorax sp.]|nr:two component, sigma54 specific, transcriptional regulator, Fis family [Variovorax sp.]
MGHALIVEDDGDASKMLASLVVREGHTVACAATLRDARRLLLMQPPDLLLLDLYLPDGSGLELFEGSLLSDTEVVLITGQASLKTSIEALRLGAADYLVKPVNPQHLKALLARLIRPSLLRAQVHQLTEQWRQTGRFGPLIGASEPMQRVYQQIARVAATAVTVFVHGESGTGKELVARAVHDLGRRRELPFLAVNCGAISPNLIESEIFGHERGSFTGAERQHLGFFERAHGGTLFLDEVTEMPVALQVKLLRVLETGTFMRVGSTQLQQTDVRIVAATNRSAAQAVAQGTLREDLFYRLNVFPIGLPPLRDRGDDVAMLAESFLQELCRDGSEPKRFSQEALDSLRQHAWPGNVRELRNAVQRAWVMARGPVIDRQWLPLPQEATRHGDGAAPATPPSDGPVPAPWKHEDEAGPASGPVVTVRIGSPLADAERALILATYEHCGRQKERTASMLGISMKTLYNRLKEYQASVVSHAA